MKKFLLIIIIFLCAFIIGCNNNDVQDDITAKQNKEVWKTENFEDGWNLKTNIIDNEYGTYLGNGFLGIRLFSKGVSNENDLSYMAGVYGNEDLINVPNIADLRFYEVNKSNVTEFVIQDKNYSQNLNMKDATLTTECELKAGKKRVNLTLNTKVLRLNDNSCKVLVDAKVKSGFNGKFFVVAPIIFDKNLYDYKNHSYIPKQKSLTKALYTKNIIVSNNIDIQKEKVNIGAICSGNFEEQTQALFNVDKNQEFSFSYLSQISKEPIDELKYNENLIKEHNNNWANLWKSDIIIEGDPQAQQVSRSNIFYLLCSSSKDYSIAPMGLSMNAFNGHVFWDSELWMFPALIWQYPELAKGIIEYRIKTLPGAKENAKKNNMVGAEYAWESGETGIEKSPDESTIFERHINGDIAFAIWQYYVITGDKSLLKEAYPVLKATADYWLSKVEKSSKGYEIKRVCPPDENANIVDNSVYTNAIAQINLWIASEASKILGESLNSKYMEIANNIYIGVDKVNNRFNIYDGYRDGASIKQADPELLLYPLKYNEFIKKLDGNYNFDNDLFKNTYEYYKSKVIKNGPSMASSAHAVISSRLKQEAYSDFTNSYKPYMRGYFNYFNEKRSHTYVYWCFLTGAGSSYASELWGFCGLDADLYNNYEKADFKYSNNLPKEWKSVTLKNISFKGKKYDLIYKDGKVIKKKL